MSLAQRLNDLARANSDGLLNDDEYRILRQSAFQLYADPPSGPSSIPSPPSSPRRRLPTEPRRPPSPRVSSSSHAPTSPPPSPTRTKSSVASGVASLIRRATGRRAPVSSSDSPTPRRPSAEPHSATPTEPAAKRSILPRILQKRPADLVPIRTGPSSDPRDPPHSPRLAHARSQPSISLLSPKTPSSVRSIPVTVPTPLDDPNVFDDDNLHTSTDIRRAIALTEDELHRLLDAFRALEATTRQRLQPHQSSLLDGREWRKPSPLSPPSSPRRPDATDGISIRSGSSTLTTLSASKSISSRLPRSPFSPHFRTPSFSLRRKNSLSSVSSRSTAPPLRVPNSGSSWSKSTGHLPLRMLAESNAPQEEEEPEDLDPEVADVRRRSEEVRARYKARLNYLHAKLKGALLHERLLRK